MKLIIKIVFIIIAIGFVSGFIIKYYGEEQTGEIIIGISVLASSFILMPLFLYHRWKGKKLEDYTLTKERIDEMKNNKF